MKNLVNESLLISLGKIDDPYIVYIYDLDIEVDGL